MGFGLWKSENKNHKKGFSDEEIDAFIADLKEKDMTVESEQDVKEIIHSSANDDPRRLCEKELSPLLIMGKDTYVYRLWSQWSKTQDDIYFEPLEYMSEHIEAAHEIWLHNSKMAYSADNMYQKDENNQLNSESAEDKLDDNEKEILNFERDIEKYASLMYNLRNIFSGIQSTKGIDNLQLKGEISDENNKNSINLKSLGGFESFDEAVKELESLGITLENDIPFEVPDAAVDEYIEKVLQEQEHGEDTSEEESTDDVSEDAAIKFRLSEDKIRAWIFIFPPVKEKNDISEDDIQKLLNDKDITYGVDKFMIHKIVKEKLYFKIIQISTGVDPVRGKDGSVNELISRERKIQLKEDQHGKVNYRELNTIASVAKGETICDIIPPTKGTDGHTVTNQISKSEDGKYPDVPQGMNTELTENRTKLVAKIDGEVKYENGKFRVQKLLRIEGDVDSSVGNIDFQGDLIVNGDIREGFTIKVGGDLLVKGTVEPCTLIVGGKISIEHSVLGCKKTNIRCGGTFGAKHVENCCIYAKGSINVGSILWSDVSTDDSVTVNSENGSITGGRITAGKTVKAMAIGSKNNSSIDTKIILGSAPSDIEKKEYLIRNIEIVKENISKMQQNINYIEGKNASVSPERKKLLNQLKLQFQMRIIQKSQMEKRLSKTSVDLIRGLSNAKLYCDCIYPVVSVTIGGQTVAIKKESKNCRVTFINNEIKVDLMQV